MYKVGIFVQKKDGNYKLVKWLPERYESVNAADAACAKKNADLGAITGCVLPGHKFAMFE